MKGTPIEWDPDMDDLLNRLDNTQPRLSYQAIGQTMTIFLEMDIGPGHVHRRLKEMGKAPRKPRGVPFGSQARELICR